MSERRIGLSLTGAVLPFALACTAWYTRRALPRLRGELEVRGLDSGVEVHFDQWGVPHIQAGSLDDALFAQGYVTAQDRMVQMEIFRLLAEGRLAEVMGKSALSLDIFMRDLGLGRVAGIIAKRMPPDTRRFLNVYSAGVNAYLESRRRSLPLELLALARGRPRPWSAEDALAAELLFTWEFDATWTADLMRGRLIRKLGKEEAERLLPASGPTNIPVLQYEGEVERPPAIEPPPECEMEFFGYDAMKPPWMTRKVSVQVKGSNNWVIGGGMSSSGKPVLCNDPHAQHSIPSLFYLCHIRAEESACNAVGATLPGIPGIIMGRNESIAWGETSLSADAVDIYIETFEDEDSNRYLAGGCWRDAEVIEEEIKIFPGRRVKHEVVITRHGPVIARKGDKGLALKWVGHDPDNDSAGCIVRMAMAGNWEEFTGCTKGYSGPAVNIVYADVEGNIGYCAAARLPVREGHDGSVPLPGESDDYEWKGYIPAEEMPHALNPDRGWIATANNQVVDDKYPYIITTMWEPSCRQGRIAELLSSRERHDVEDMRRMQGDVFTCRGSIFRREVLGAAAGEEELSPRVRQALGILADWDCLAVEESVAQTLYFMSWRVLTERLLRHRLGHPLYFEYVTSFFNVSQAVEGILVDRRAEWLPPSASDYDELLMHCVREAVVRLETRFGNTDMSEWEWGRFNRLEVTGYMGSFWPLSRFLDLGPVPLKGDGETVCCVMMESDHVVQVLARSMTGGGSGLQFLPRFHSDRAYAGAVFRMIVDLSDTGKSIWCLDAGQCSNRLSRYYGNFFPLWHKVDYAPMVFSQKKVEELTRSTLVLKPER